MAKSDIALFSNPIKKVPNSTLMKKREKCLPTKYLIERVKMANKFPWLSKRWIPVNLVLKACVPSPWKFWTPMTTHHYLIVRYFKIFKKNFFQKWQKLKFPVLKMAKFQFLPILKMSKIVKNRNSQLFGGNWYVQ